jgi:predicted signal transduction protein with EAL and GGDEF domain
METLHNDNNRTVLLIIEATAQRIVVPIVYGPAAGFGKRIVRLQGIVDRPLATATAAHRKLTRPADLSARYGGKEFAMILPETDHTSACRVAQRLKGALAGRATAHGAPGTDAMVTISMGVATPCPR